MGHEGEDKVEAADLLGSGADVYEGNELLHIASTMADADIDVVRRRVEKMDNFRKLATDALDVLERHHHATLGANNQSQEWFHRACQDTRDIFRAVLAQDLEWEQQRYVLDLLMKLVQMEGAKDTESKNLLSSLSDKLSNKMVLIGGVAITATAVAVAIVAPKAVRQVGEALRRG
ncbi:hypothetical protein ACI2K4_22410 [Micromonospora sp. NPDC050397]|uniref:hypothetical protein n=1 Tax=Micromonospora sp. NPDC050397 TaxID=3364279 RepID=UPI00384B7191